MTNRKWRGHLGPMMENHLKLREAVGRVGESDGYNLYAFNEFILQKYPRIRTVSRIVVLDFLRSKTNLGNAGRRNCVIHIRQFCRYLIQRGTASYVPDRTLTPKYQYKPRYCPISEVNFQRILSLVNTTDAESSVGADTYVTIFSLLWCTGMRRREIIRLTQDDVDLKNGVLFIRESKFQKDRIIPLNDSVVKGLQKYVALKESLRLGARSGARTFFICLDGKPIAGTKISRFFRLLAEELGIKNAEGRRATLHDFRHNFATINMAEILRNPEKYPTSTAMATLSTYMGHVDLFYTQYYLHPDFDLLQDALEKFESPAA